MLHPTPQSVADVLRGRWLVPPADAAAPFPWRGVSIDSRAIDPGQVFFAIAGERFDGHDFVADALTRRPAIVIVHHERDYGPAATPIFLVSDTLTALQNLASAWRNTLAARRCAVVAVAGSNGKTTTRHLIHHVLSATGLTGTQSPKSFNNHIGVPLTLLAAGVETGSGDRVPGPVGEDDPHVTRASAEPGPRHPEPAPPAFVVVEAGTNHPGELAVLGNIIRPDVAVITSIGREHLEFFGDLAGVAREELSLLRFVGVTGVSPVPPAAILPAEAPFPEDIEIDVPVGVEVVEFDASDPAAQRVALPGAHNRANAAAAAEVARRFGVDDATIAAALATVSAVDGRSQVIKLGQGVTLINDSYNANPDSMLAALATLREFPGRKVAVLGDMLELGDAGLDAHPQVAAAARDAADVVVLVGERFGGQPWRDALRDEVAALVRPGDVVLLKASRGIRLERLIPGLQSKFPCEPRP